MSRRRRSHREYSNLQSIGRANCRLVLQLLKRPLSPLAAAHLGTESLATPWRRLCSSPRVAPKPDDWRRRRRRRRRCRKPQDPFRSSQRANPRSRPSLR